MNKARKYLKRSLAVSAAALAAFVLQPASASAGEPAGGGGVDSKIVGGVPAEEGEFPFIVYLGGCGGSLYAPDLVLTAAHCVDDKADDEITVTAGTNDKEDPDAIRVQSTEITIAPGYEPPGMPPGPESGGSDWALVKIEKPLDLPTLNIAPDDRYNEGDFQISGWGFTEPMLKEYPRQLHKATVPFVDDAACSAAFPNHNFIPEEEICAGYLGEGKIDSCYGDSGTPMFRKDENDKWVQVGIVSWSIGCARAEYPGVYTEVGAFADEIKKAAADLSS